MIDGHRLLALFALVMMVIARLMLKTRVAGRPARRQDDRANTPAIVGLGLATGTMSGFFGIGGGFLIVPALMLATGMPIMNAVSSSLVAVTAFGLTTAASYAWSGLISWGLAGLFVAGGIAGGLIGTRSARLLPARAARSISCSPWSLLRWRSICWRVTYPYPGRRTWAWQASETNMKKSIEQGRTVPAPPRKRLACLGGRFLGSASTARRSPKRDERC